MNSYLFAFNLYAFNNVIVHLCNGHIQYGKLTNLSETAVVLDNEFSILMTDILDIEHRGIVSDYQTYHKRGFIGDYVFELEDLTQGFDVTRLVYNEYICEIACHLVMSESEIRATDIRLLSYRHKDNAPLQSKEAFIYRYEDGHTLVGTVADGSIMIQNSHTQLPFTMDGVETIWRAPQRGEFVIVSLSDGSRKEGLVTAIDDDRFVLMGENAVDIIQFSDITQLRCRGTTSVMQGPRGTFIMVEIKSGAATTGFVCKIPYLNNETDVERMYTGMIVTFEPGMNDRGLIAKNVVIEKNQGEKSGDYYTGVGIILNYRRNNNNNWIGYIGNAFYHRAYNRDIRGKSELPEGFVRFGKQDFNYDPRLIYVVSYTCAGKPDLTHRLACVGNLQVIRTYEKKDYASVCVLEDDSVIALPASVAYISYYLNRVRASSSHRPLEVQVTRSDGSFVHGIVLEYTEQSLSLLTPTGTVSVPIEKIDSVQYYESITSCTQARDGGYTENGVFFHVNDLRDAVDKIQLFSSEEIRGWTLSYTLSLSPKGNGLAAIDGAIYSETNRKGMISACEDGSVVLRPVRALRDTAAFRRYPLELIWNGVDLGALQSELQQSEIGVDYILRQRGGEDTVILTGINDIRAGRNQKGFVTFYHTENRYGFITPETQLEEKKKDWNRRLNEDRYFKVPASLTFEGAALDTYRYYYEVVYRLNPAGQPEITSMTQKLPKYTQKQAPKPVSAQESIDLKPRLQINADLYKGVQWEIGFLNLASTRFGVIYKKYINKHYSDSQKTPLPDSLPILFDPALANTLNLKTVRFRTAKLAYCVRVVVKGTVINEVTGVEQPTIDYRYPIEVLEEFEKSSYISIVWANDFTLQCKKIPITVHSTPHTGEMRILPEMSGENVYIVCQNGNQFFDTIQAVEKDGLMLRFAGRIPEDQIKIIYRFGVVTDFSEADNRGEINGATEFSLNVLEKATYNILKNQLGSSVRLHVMYHCSSGTVTEVFRYSEDVRKLSRITSEMGKQGEIIGSVKSCIPWTHGIVTGIDPTKREVIVDDCHHHFITVRTDSQISKRFRDGTLIENKVFFKYVSHPFLLEGSEEPELFFSAFDVICEKESVQLRFLPSANQYYGYRSQTDFFPVRGIEEQGDKLQDQTIEIEWHPVEANNRIEAWVAGNYSEDAAAHDEEEELRETEDNLLVQEDIRQHPIFRHWCAQVNLSDIPILVGKVDLDEHGRPKDRAAIRSAISMLERSLRKRGRKKFDSWLIALIQMALQYDASIPHVDEKDQEIWINRAIHRMFRAKARSAPSIRDLSFGESNYYLSVLIAYTTFDEQRKQRQDWSWELCMFRLFASDFLEPRELQRVYRSSGGLSEELSWQQLIATGTIKEKRNLPNLVSQLLLLDNNSAEIVSEALNKNTKLLSTLNNYIDSHALRTGGSNDVVGILREKYREFRRANEARIHSILVASENEFVRQLLDWLNDLQMSFLHLICTEDVARFQELRDLCSRFQRYNSRYIGYREQKQELDTILHLSTTLEKNISEHPCRDSFELLCVVKNDAQQSLLSRFREEIQHAGRKLLKDSRPSITVEPVDEILIHGEQLLQLAVSNNSKNQRSQPARNLTVVVESLTDGVQAGDAMLSDLTTLDSGECAEVQVPISVDITQELAKTIVIHVQWRATYDYDSDNDTGGMNTSGSDEGVFDLQLATGIINTKDTNHDKNPYTKAAEGKPLTAEDIVFVGRTEELADIENTIQQTVEGKKRFAQGATVLLYGQRKCGKTSLINKLIGDINSDSELREQAILIEFADFLSAFGTITSLSAFRRQQYRLIIQKFRDEVKKKHPELWSSLERENMLPPDIMKTFKMSPEEVADFFVDYFAWFREWDQGKHAIIILADEYSRLPVRILEMRNTDEVRFRMNQLIDIPSYVRRFSMELGFVQIFIGHNSMIRSLTELGTWNHTGEFARVIKLAELKNVEARELITRPVEIVQGYDAYDSPLGKPAIQSLCDLSGNMPMFLMRLCDKVYDDYIDSPETWISKRHVDRAVAALLDQNDDKLFDILFTEDDDDPGIPEERKTYRFLESAAHCALKSVNRRSADENVISMDMRSRYGDAYVDQYFSGVRNLLEARGVITINNGQIKIKSGLFLEHIRRRNG